MPMQRTPLLGGIYRLQFVPCEGVIKHGGNAADGEAENQALDVKTRPLREVKQARRIPILRHEERLGETERHRKNTDAPHDPPLHWKHGKENQPGRQKSARPEKPDVMLRNSHSEILRKRSAFTTTETELKLMAAPAMMGLRSRPRDG